jgi:hypothetical protein
MAFGARGVLPLRQDTNGHLAWPSRTAAAVHSDRRAGRHREMTTTKAPEVEELMNGWMAATEGRRSARRSLLTKDRERPDTYVQVVEFRGRCRHGFWHVRLSLSCSGARRGAGGYGSRTNFGPFPAGLRRLSVRAGPVRCRYGWSWWLRPVLLNHGPAVTTT